MPASITVDTTNATATAAWEDDHGDVTTAPANAAALVFGSDAPTVATVATDATNPAQGDITPVAVGTFNVIVAAPLDTAGAPLLEADGVTAFAAPAPVNVTVTAGPASQLVLSVTA